MKLGIFGGTFDPVHLGHLILAEWCREACDLDEVWFVPAASPPHKDDHRITDGKQRVEMLELAIAGCPRMAVSRIEFDREGPSYTVDTLSALREEGIDRELFLLIGGDSLNDLGGWREPERIAELATIVAVNRGREQPRSDADLRQQLGDTIAERVVQVAMPALDLSSTVVRSRVGAGQSIRFQVPRAVEAYVREHGLYVTDA